MQDPEALSEREKEALELLLQGKSNKQIALALGISVHTVEFHLKNIYRKLQVSSRPELFSKLRGAPSLLPGGKPGDSVVASGRGTGDNRIDPAAGTDWAHPDGSSGTQGLIRSLEKAKSWILLGILLGIGLVIMLNRLSPREILKRECEYPDAANVGRTLSRSNASGSTVHGQFGAAPDDPWPGQPGYVAYQNVRLPKIDQAMLKLRYSKDSLSSTPILIYLDQEPEPRASFLPLDQRDWNLFAWSEPIDLGRIENGLHSIKLTTQGQQYGVADLDQWVIIQKP